MPDVVAQEQPGQGVVAESAAPAANPMYPTGRLHSTIKDDVSSSDTFTQDSQPAGKPSTDPGTANNIQGESGKEGAGEGDKGTPATTDGKPKPDTDDFSEERFDKNPMFQRLNKSIRRAEERAIAAEAKAEALMKMKGGGTEGGQPGDDMVNILDMEDADLREQFDTNPKTFLANFGRQMFREFQERFEEGRKTSDFQTAQRGELETYANANPDFIEKWESGDIPDYMKKHPGHTAMSAHMALTEPQRMQAKIDAAVKEAVQKTRDEERRNAGVRLRGATVLPASSGVPRESKAEDAILKDTSKVGGRTNAIMQILRMRRSG